MQVFRFVNPRTAILCRSACRLWTIRQSKGTLVLAFAVRFEVAGAPALRNQCAVRLLGQACIRDGPATPADGAPRIQLRAFRPALSRALPRDDTARSSLDPSVRG